jgi:hypothetical protein
LNFSLPFSVPVSGVLLLAATGAIAGIYFFFHGFSLLQERALASRGHAQRQTTQHKTVSATTTFTTQDSNSLKLDSHREVIHLSASDGPPPDSSCMTQQGKIAAALLKAGIRNPVTSADNRLQTEVRLREETAPGPGSATQLSDADVSRAIQKSVNSAEIPLPSLEVKAACTPSSWETSLMIWGGPALTLICIYILAARLGWL